MKTRDHLRVITSTKRSFWAFLALIAACGLALNSRATVLINDTWQDAERTNPPPTVTAPFTTTYSENGIDQDADTDLESAWFSSATANMIPSSGHLVMSNIAAGSTSFTTYIATNSDSLTLAATGDQLKVTWVFSNLGANVAQNTSQNMRLALVNTGAGARLTADGTPAAQTYSGYAMFLNMGTITGRSTPFNLLSRTAVNSALLSASGPWTSKANAAGFGNGAAGYIYGGAVTYTNVWTLTLLSGGNLEIGVSMTGSNLNGVGSVSVVFTDSAPASLSYDTFSLRPSTGATTADQFDTTLFRVELITVPEPSTLALAVAGLGLMVAVIRRRR